MHTVNIEDFARYIGLSLLLKGIDISPLKLQKLLYYNQAWHMVIFGKEYTLFVDKPQAWVNGPVYPAIYRIYKEKVPNMYDKLNYSHFESCEDCFCDIDRLVKKMNLCTKEIELSNRINELYGTKTQEQLVLLTHSEKPWCEQRENLLPYEYSENEISLETMFSYYRERYEKNRKKQ